MFLILLCYLLMASTFTLAKVAVTYMQPIYFIAFRMIIAGILLLAYLYFFKRSKLRFSRSDLKLFALIVIFHIYCAYVFEFWAVQYLNTAKVSLIYNLSPFITALLMYFIYKQNISCKKWFALVIHSAQEQALPEVWFLSLAELSLIFAVGAAAYGWIIMRELTVKKGYSTALVNGMGMLWGGFAALVTAVIIEGGHPFIWQQMPEDMLGKFLLPQWGVIATSLAMAALAMISLIIIANIVGYNLYGFLLGRYSPTLLAFFGFITPFFVGIFGWIFLAESLSVPFFISLGLTIMSLYIFYREELTF
jgi:drug/metabolite transporter (DMT)-like permease